MAYRSVQSTIHNVAGSRSLPNLDKLSILAATILLAYSLARLINLPSQQINLQLPGFFFVFAVNSQTFAAILVAGLTATGVDWLIREHPRLGKSATYEHWLVPSLTALTIGLPLFDLPLNYSWWIGLGFGGALLMLVILAEYIVVDTNDLRQPIASAALTAVSFALFLALLIALRYEEIRLFQYIPIVALSTLMVCLRTLKLQLNRWAIIESGVIALLISQWAAAAHYWALSPVSHGLLILGPAFCLTRLMGELNREKHLRQVIVEPIIILGLIWLAALWLR